MTAKIFDPGESPFSVSYWVPPLCGGRFPGIGVYLSMSPPSYPSARLLSCLLTPPLLFFSGLLQFLIALGPDRLGAAFQLVERCQVADRAVQANSVVMVDVARQQALRLFDRRRHARSEAFPFERLMPALDLAVRLDRRAKSAHGSCRRRE